MLCSLGSVPDDDEDGAADDTPDDDAVVEPDVDEPPDPPDPPGLFIASSIHEMICSCVMLCPAIVDAALDRVDGANDPRDVIPPLAPFDPLPLLPLDMDARVWRFCKRNDAFR